MEHQEQVPCTGEFDLADAVLVGAKAKNHFARLKNKSDGVTFNVKGCGDGEYGTTSSSHLTRKRTDIRLSNYWSMVRLAAR